MASKLPYMVSPGKIPAILNKIQEARRPERFTQDFLETKLGHSGGASRPMIPLLKRLGFLASDGTPTPRYDKFRNQASQGSAMAAGIREAFSELYERNEYAHEMTKDKLVGLVTEITGATKDDRVTQAVVSSFEALKEFADFDEDSLSDDVPATDIDHSAHTTNHNCDDESHNDVELRVGYTINLNLPESTNPEVFNAIFKALRENLLRK